MTNDEPRTARETTAELLRLQVEREQADKELLAAMERSDRPEVKRLRYRVNGLMHDIAALRFDLMAEQVSRQSPSPPAGGGPGWMGMVENPDRHKD